MSDFLETARAAFQPGAGPERVKRLLDNAEARSIRIPVKSGGTEETPAAVFEVTCFRTVSPIVLALHNTPFVGSDEVCWSVTETRSGLSVANSFYWADDALLEAMGKIAIALCVEGEDGLNKRIVTMPGSLVAESQTSSVNTKEKT